MPKDFSEVAIRGDKNFGFETEERQSLKDRFSEGIARHRRLRENIGLARGSKKLMIRSDARSIYDAYVPATVKVNESIVLSDDESIV